MGFSMGGGGLMGLTVRVRMGGRGSIELMYTSFLDMFVFVRGCLRMLRGRTFAQL